jgi:hypothetical protein
MAYENSTSSVTTPPGSMLALARQALEQAPAAAGGADFLAALVAQFEANGPVPSTVSGKLPQLPAEAGGEPARDGTVQAFFNYVKGLGYNPPVEILEGAETVVAGSAEPDESGDISADDALSSDSGTGNDVSPAALAEMIAAYLGPRGFGSAEPPSVAPTPVAAIPSPTPAAEGVVALRAEPDGKGEAAVARLQPAVAANRQSASLDGGIEADADFDAQAAAERTVAIARDTGASVSASGEVLVAAPNGNMASPVDAGETSPPIQTRLPPVAASHGSDRAGPMRISVSGAGTGNENAAVAADSNSAASPPARFEAPNRDSEPEPAVAAGIRAPVLGTGPATANQAAAASVSRTVAPVVDAASGVSADGRGAAASGSDKDFRGEPASRIGSEAAMAVSSDDSGTVTPAVAVDDRGVPPEVSPGTAGDAAASTLVQPMIDTSRPASKPAVPADGVAPPPRAGQPFGQKAVAVNVGQPLPADAQAAPPGLAVGKPEQPGSVAPVRDGGDAENAPVVTRPISGDGSVEDGPDLPAGRDEVQAMADGNEVQMPVRGDGTRAPIGGDNAQIPAGGNDVRALTGGNDAPVPAGGNGAQAPAGRDATPVSADGNDVQAQAGGNNAPAPVGRDVAQVLAGGNNAPVPAGRDVAQVLAGGNNSPAPVGRDVAQVSAGGNSTPMPAGRDDAPVLAGGNSMQAPAGMDDARAPVGGNGVQMTVGKDDAPVTVGSAVDAKMEAGGAEVGPGGSGAGIAKLRDEPVTVSAPATPVATVPEPAESVAGAMPTPGAAAVSAGGAVRPAGQPVGQPVAAETGLSREALVLPPTDFAVRESKTPRAAETVPAAANTAPTDTDPAAEAPAETLSNSRDGGAIAAKARANATVVADQPAPAAAPNPANPIASAPPLAAAVDGTAAAQQPASPQEAGAISRPLGQPGWSEDLGEQVTWMMDKTVHSAEIKLNPAHLGPLEVRIRLDRDQAEIHFSSEHAAVREAIEAATPKLREMLGNQQINLAEVSVAVPSHQTLPESGGQSSNFDRQPRFGYANAAASANVADREEVAATEANRPVTGNGSISFYA